MVTSTKQMHGLSLFSGAGGGLLATKWLLGWRAVCYVENNPYRVEVLKARIRDGLLNDAPIWDDARTFDGRPWAGSVDIVTAGFPCQPFSQAGKRLADRDERNLWPDTIRIIREVQPGWVLLENVPRLLTFDYIRRIFGDLAESGYDARWDCIPASAVGANHQRDRLWIVAYAHSSRLKKYPQFHGEAQQDSPDRDSCGRHTCGCSDEMADSNQQGPSQRKEKGFIPNLGSIKRQGWWQVEPLLGRVADELANRMDEPGANEKGAL